MSIKVGDIMLCTVKRIESASVLVEMEDKRTGSIVMSEVAAGRIRNLREYIAPNKKIVCKVLSMDNSHIQLSLRRVTAKERDEALAKYQKERTLSAMLKAIVSNYREVIEHIKKEYELSDFSDEIRVNQKLLHKFLKKAEAEQIIKILQEKSEGIKKVKKIFLLRTINSQGLDELKLILSIKDADIHYLGSSQFSISVSGKNFKEANTKIQSILKDIESKAKTKKIFFEAKE